MKQAVANLKLGRIPDIGALCILPTIGAFSSVFGFLMKEYVEIKLDS
jgi:hypothetical protein